MHKKGLFVLLSTLNCLVLNAQVWMTPNRGQWDERIEYKVDLQMGEMYVEEDGFTFNLHDAKQKLEHAHDHGDEHEEHAEELPNHFGGHVIRAQFVGSNWAGNQLATDSSSFYSNFLLGNNRATWKSFVRSYADVTMFEFYPGIDFKLNGTNDVLEYAFAIQPNADPNQIQMHVSGDLGVRIDKSGQLLITSRFGDIVLTKPIAWQMNGDRLEEVAVRFELKNGDIYFEFPDSYDPSRELIIDPDIVFSTFSGSTADNWGTTATPDINGNLFGGGTVFGVGYPTTAGVYDASFNGGNVDIGITKFNATGTSLLYSTYIGGSGSETPNSMICNAAGELFIYGLTSSSNFPMAGTPYDNTFAGGPDISSQTSTQGFSEGTDLYIARLSANGSNLVASTFIGGSDTDGYSSGTLMYNYGDANRGEIVLDVNGNVYVASCTRSTNFPVVGNMQASLSGTQDAVAFKMPPSLSSLLWSGYFGGTGFETGNSIKVASNGNTYMVGGTTSSLAFSQGHDLTYDSDRDGYIVRFNGTNGAILSGSFIGQAEYQQAYLVELDDAGSVYVLGQSESDMGITSTHYGNANSGLFLRKYNNTLTTLDWTTMIGASTGHVEISPTAFLVSNCLDIYIAGWGGSLNQSNGQASFSTTSGLAVTADAYQGTTSGSNFYICVLDEDAMNLKYGTFIGGFSSSYNHVDGGTSRFDSLGRIYHAVCGGCGGNPNGFSTTPGVWSPTNESGNCNLAAFKFELSTIEPIISTPNNVVCLPDPVIFNNNSANGNAFFWDFGDGTYSNEVNPTHVYPGPGTYSVTLIVTDTNGCYTMDSVEMEVFIGDFTGSVVTPTGPICPGASYQFEASGGSTYQWSPAQYLDNPTIWNPTATIDVTTEFMVIISDTCGLDTAYVTLNVLPVAHTVSDDVSVCIGDGTPLSATGGVSYNWIPATYLDDPTSPTPFSTPDQTIEYQVEITTVEGCTIKDSVTVTVYYTPPIPVMPDLVTICAGSSQQVTVSGAETYTWSPNSFIAPIDGPVVTVNPPSSMWYYCDFLNPCGTEVDSMFVEVIIAAITAGTDTIICPGQSVQLWASGGVAYVWYPAATLSNVNTSLVTATPTSPTLYTVQGVDQYGCVAWDSVFVDLFPQAFIQTNPDVYAFYGDEVQLTATSTTEGIYIWSPPEFLSCVSCSNPIATPNQNYGYLVSYTDANGCSYSDSVHIYYDPIIYVPNSFTPNGDGMNQFFLALGGNIRTFEMQIFDRWGELIFTSNELLIGWDGKYEGNICQDGTYIWKIKITDFEDQEVKYVGHVNLIR